MSHAQRIREVCERNIKILNSRPRRGRLTGATRAHVDTGLRCTVTEGRWSITTDLPAKAGGEDTGPTPGMLGRGALASCLAIGIVMWAARLGVPLESVDVQVEADFDVRGELGLADVAAGYDEVRRHIAVKSSASVRSVLDVIETAEQHSPYLSVFRGRQQLQRHVRLNDMEV